MKKHLEEKKKESGKIENELEKARQKIKNQELLIDEYRNSLEEQICLEKEVIKSNYQERERQQKCKFEEALRAM